MAFTLLSNGSTFGTQRTLINAIITDYNSVVDPQIAPDTAWTAVTFTNSWVNSGGGLQEVQYRKDSAGWVNVRGHCKDGTVNAAMFALPTGYRPAAILQFGIDNNLALGRIQAGTDGTFLLATGGSNVRVSLNGIRFFAG